MPYSSTAITRGALSPAKAAKYWLSTSGTAIGGTTSRVGVVQVALIVVAFRALKKLSRKLLIMLTRSGVDPLGSAEIEEETRMNTKQIKSLIRAGYAWLGGYAIYLVTSDGGTLCTDCARKEYRQLCKQTK